MDKVRQMLSTVENIYAVDKVSDITRLTVVETDKGYDIVRYTPKDSKKYRHDTGYLVGFKPLNYSYSIPINYVDHVKRMPNLVELILRPSYENGRLDIPDNLLDRAKNLSHLELTGNVVINDAGRLIRPAADNLVVLKLENANIDSLHEIRMPALAVLWLSYCTYRGDEALYLGYCPVLRELYVGDSEPMLLPDVQDCGELESLIVEACDLSNDNISSYDWSDLKQMEWLQISFCRIRGTLNESIGQMTKLQGLKVDNNQLEGELPKSMADLKELDLLDVSNNSFTGGLEHLVGLKKLRILDISYNQFVEIPADLIRDELTHLIVAGNPLENLPSIRRIVKSRKQR